MTHPRMPLLMSTLLDRGSLISPDQEIVTKTTAGIHKQTYLQTKERACQLASALETYGIKPGDRIGTMMWNNHRHLELYQAVPCMGSILHTLNVRLSPRELEYIANHAEDRIIFVDEDQLPTLEGFSPKLKTVERIIVCSELGKWKTNLSNVMDYEEFIGNHAKNFEWPVLEENAGMGLCYTSGTTGNPKGVLYTHRSTYVHTLVQAMTDGFSLSAQDSIMMIVPMFHAMSWGMPFTGMMLGSKQVLPHRFMDPKDLLDLMAQEEVTVSGGVPTILQGLKTAIEEEPKRWDLSKLQRLICGGSAPAASLIRWFDETLGVEMMQGWGMTETNPSGTVARRIGKRSERNLPREKQFENMAKAGLINPGLEMKIVDEEFKPLPRDGEAIGELLVRGPSIITEYFKDPQPSKFHDGWLITGDVAKIDSEEYLIIADRSKDLIKSGGEWISSVDLENHIMAMPEVNQAAVVAQPHPKWGERPVVLVVIHPGKSLAMEAVLKHCQTTFAKWQLPDDLLFEKEIPLTSTGKIDKKKIRSNLTQRGYTLPNLKKP